MRRQRALEGGLGIEGRMRASSGEPVLVCGPRVDVAGVNVDLPIWKRCAMEVLPEDGD